MFLRLNTTRFLSVYFNVCIVSLAITMFLPARQNTIHILYMAYTLLSFFVAAVVSDRRYAIASNRESVLTAVVWTLVLIVTGFMILGLSKLLSFFSAKVIMDWFRPYFVLLQYPIHVLIGFVIVRNGVANSAYRYFRISCCIVLIYWLIGAIKGTWAPHMSFASQFHNSFVAFCSVTMSVYLIINTVNNKYKGTLKFLSLTLVFLLTLLPFFGYLRASSIATTVVLIVVFWGLRNSSATKLGAYLFILAFFSVYVFGNRIESVFSQGSYGYRNPMDVIIAASDPSEPNAVWRMNTWTESAMPTFISSPLFGSSFSYNFDPTMSNARGSGMFHSFWVSVLVDGGIVLFVPFLALFLYPLVVGLRAVLRFHNTQLIAYVCWQLLVLGTISTNTWGYGPIQSGILGMSYGLASAVLVYRVPSTNTHLSHHLV